MSKETQINQHNPLHTSHSGYHWDEWSKRFFEGWKLFDIEYFLFTATCLL